MSAKTNFTVRLSSEELAGIKRAAGHKPIAEYLRELIRRGMINEGSEAQEFAAVMDRLARFDPVRLEDTISAQREILLGLEEAVRRAGKSGGGEVDADKIAMAAAAKIGEQVTKLLSEINTRLGIIPGMANKVSDTLINVAEIRGRK